MTKSADDNTGFTKFAVNFTPGRRRLLNQRFKTVPYPNHLGMKIKAMKPGYTALTFRVIEELKQYQGLLHGGAIASLADTAATIAALTIIPSGLDLITVEMKGNFLASVEKGTVTAEADVLHMGKRTSVIECSLYARGRRLIWKGTFTCLHFDSSLNMSG